MELHDSIDALDASLIQLHKALFQHRSWLALQKEAGVTIDRADAALLKALAFGDNHCTRPQDLARQLGIEAPSLTRTAQQLETAGLITRSPDPTDGRAFNLAVTPQGRAQLKKLQKARRIQLEKVVKGWSIADRDSFVRLLRTFAEDLTTITTKP